MVVIYQCAKETQSNLWKGEIMKYGHTIIYVSSVEETLEFYKEAFGFDVKFIHESKAYGELESGETTLAFASHEMGEMNLGSNYSKANINDKPFGIELAFVTEDVPAAFEKAVISGAIAIKEPEEKPWGQIVEYVRAVDGSPLQVIRLISTLLEAPLKKQCNILYN